MKVFASSAYPCQLVFSTPSSVGRGGFVLGPLMLPRVYLRQQLIEARTARLLLTVFPFQIAVRPPASGNLGHGAALVSVGPGVADHPQIASDLGGHMGRRLGLHLDCHPV